MRQPDVVLVGEGQRSARRVLDRLPRQLEEIRRRTLPRPRHQAHTVARLRSETGEDVGGRVGGAVVREVERPVGMVLHKEAVELLL